MYISDFKQKMNQIWPKRAIFVFPKKCEKPQFLGILGQNGQFWTVFGQNEKNENFSKKRLERFFTCCLRDFLDFLFYRPKYAY